MTYVEFFDKALIENLCATLITPPDRVIFIGDNLKLLKKQVKIYKDVLSARNIDVEFICKCVWKNNMQNILNSLTEIVETYDDCVFDLTGGGETYLVAAGIISERYKNKNIQMHRINIRNNSINDCDLDGATILQSEMPCISIEENIRIYGGDIVFEDTKKGSTRRWEWSDEFTDDIEAMWNICRTDVRRWNTQIGIFALMDELFADKNDPLTLRASMSDIRESLSRKGVNDVSIKAICKDLRKAGLITEYCDDASEFIIKFKNEQIKSCLTKSGQALEMKICVVADKTKDKDGQRTFNDVMSGVYIDWDRDVQADQEKYSTENEVDVIAMHGMVPIFISCKNGRVDIDELYKLETVANRFGGKYAKKILVATALDNGGNAVYIRQRANDMKIRVIENVQSMKDEELQRIMRSCWSN